MRNLDYLDHLARESARFADVLSATAPDARVPTCPGWDADDLLWHLAEVQWFWGTTADSWFVSLGQFTGTDPDDQRSYDQPGISVADKDPGTETAATISGAAADLDCWLWGRPTQGTIERSGDPTVIHGFDAVIADGIS